MVTIPVNDWVPGNPPPEPPEEILESGDHDRVLYEDETDEDEIPDLLVEAASNANEGN